MLRRLRSFARLSASRRAMLTEATACLAAARAALILVPFPRIARRLGTFVPPTDSRVINAPVAGSREQSAIAREVGWAVAVAARNVPFAAVCLPRAMAARIMLSRRSVPSVLHFGGMLTGEPQILEAHAWLDAAGVEVTGYPLDGGLAEMACFI
jgi:hypothetical protein